MKTSKSKTFQKEEDFGEVADWILSQIGYTQDQKDVPSDFDFDVPCYLDAKYVVTVTKIQE